MPNLWRQFSDDELLAIYSRADLDQQTEIDDERIRRKLYPDYTNYDPARMFYQKR